MVYPLPVLEHLERPRWETVHRGKTHYRTSVLLSDDTYRVTRGVVKRGQDVWTDRAVIKDGRLLKGEKVLKPKNKHVPWRYQRYYYTIGHSECLTIDTYEVPRRITEEHVVIDATMKRVTTDIEHSKDQSEQIHWGVERTYRTMTTRFYNRINRTTRCNNRIIRYENYIPKPGGLYLKKTYDPLDGSVLPDTRARGAGPFYSVGRLIRLRTVTYIRGKEVGAGLFYMYSETKRGLVLVALDYVDEKKRSHSINTQRLQRYIDALPLIIRKWRIYTKLQKRRRDLVQATPVLPTVLLRLICFYI